MRVLAVDPGTSCGYAVRVGGTVEASGVWDLRPTRFEGAGMRWLRLRGFLCLVAPPGLPHMKPELVAFEEVRRHLGTDAAHIYGGVVATLQAWCEEHGVPYTAIPVGTVKKLATGKGNAKKDAMLAAARARWPEQNVTDDNQADALWIAEAAMRDYGDIDNPAAEAAKGEPR